MSDAAERDLLRAVFDRLPDAVLVADDDRRFVDANDAALALLAMPRADLIGRRIDDLVARGAASEALDVNWAALLADGRQDGEMVLYLPGERHLRVAFRGTAHAAPGRHAFVLREAGDAVDYRQAQRLEEQARIQAARLRALARASRAFMEAGMGLRPLLETIAREISTVFEGGAGVGLGTRAGRGLLMRKLHHPNPESLAALRAARAPGNARAAVEQVLQTGQSVVVAIPHEANDPIRAMMLAPLRGSQRVLGAVWASRERSESPFSPRDLAMLEDLGERAAMALENARTLRRARRTAERTQLLQNITAAISEPLNAPAVAEVVLREATATFGAASGILFRLTEDGRQLVSLAATGPMSERREPVFRRVSADAPYPIAQAVRDGEPVLLANGEERERRFPALTWPPAAPGGAAAVPLMLHGRAVGALGLAFAEERTWKAEDVAFLTGLGRHTAQALERARLFERAEEARREAQQAVTTKEQSLALLDTLLASAPVGFGFVDRELRYRRINDVLAKLDGLPGEEHIGRTVREVLPGPVADEVETILRDVLASGAPLVDFGWSGELADAPGERRHFRASYYPVGLSDAAGVSTLIVGVGILVIDVTTQTRAADVMALLAEAGAILGSSLDYDRTLGDLARLAVPRLGDWCLIDVIERGVARSVALAHRDPAKLAVGREMRARFPPRPDQPGSVYDIARHQRPRLVSRIDDATLAQAISDPEHLRLVRALGLRSSITVPMVAGGRGFGTLTLLSAESGRRYGPADVAVAEELAHRAALAVENARLYADAQDAIRVREEFLAIAGHELKTPLTALKLQLGGLLRGLERQPPTEVDRLRALARVEVTVRQAERLEKLVNQLLDVSRITAGRLALDEEEIDLGAVVREVSGRFSEETSRTGSPLTVEAREPLIGHWDRLRIEQVTTNLISNALKYGRGLPVEVRALADGDDAAVLEVRDRGIGIPPESQARIFGRFERAVPDRHYGGLGLGLWIVRQIVEAHGGTIAVDSVPDVGSRFTVRLPR